MSTRRWCLAAIAVAAFMLLDGATPASAEMTGPCEAGGTFQEAGVTIDVRQVASKRITVPRADTVSWYGSVTPVALPRQVSGFVSVKLPPPFNEISIDTWSGSGSDVSKSGEDSYDLGNWVPGGAQVTVFGEHYENDTLVCSGTVLLQVEGSPFDSPATPAALVLTAATAAGFTGTFWSLFRGKPS